ncbi:hypothetical protein Avbf_14658 [Armadillidium vulgare]|nr:hypothetical protein Avbf_14658 [Armadillidium vulgare]
MRVKQQGSIENQNEVVEEVGKETGSQAGPLEIQNVAELGNIAEGLDRPEELGNMIVVAEEMEMVSGVGELAQEGRVSIPDREMQELRLEEDPLRAPRRLTELCVSLDDHIFYSGKTKTFLGFYTNLNKEALKVSKVAWKAKSKI